MTDKQSIFPGPSGNWGLSFVLGKLDQTVDEPNVKVNGNSLSPGITWRPLKLAKAPDAFLCVSGMFPDNFPPGNHSISIPILENGQQAKTISWSFDIPDHDKPVTNICFYGALPTEYQANPTVPPLGFKSLVDHIDEFDSVVHLGDVGYNFSFVGEAFMDLIQPVASRRPYTYAVGNHEYFNGSYPSFMTAMRGQMDISDSELELINTSLDEINITTGNHVVRLGPLALILINSAPLQGNNGSWNNQDDTLNSAYPKLKTWLEGELKKIDRNVTPWVATCGHRPFWWDTDDPSKYDERRYDSDMYATAALEFKDLYDQNIDFHFAGHTHSYARTEAPNQTFSRTSQFTSAAMGGNLVGRLDFVKNVPLTTKTVEFYGYGIFSCDHKKARWTWYKIANTDTSPLPQREIFDQACWERTANGKTLITGSCDGIFPAPFFNPVITVTEFPPSSKDGLKDWQITLLVVGCILIVLAVALAVYFSRH